MNARTLGLALLAAACFAACGQDRPGPAAGSGLAAYRPAGRMLRVPGVADNASGLAWSPKTKTLFAVINAPESIIEFTRAGEKKREIVLRGFADTEGITHVEGDTFAVVEEGRGMLSLITIVETTTVVEYNPKKAIRVDEEGGNEGLEGVAYDPKSRCFYAVKEKDPRKVYKVTRDGRVSNPWDAEKNSLGLSDLSDIHFDAKTGHLILLSHESRVAVECTVDGKELSRLRVPLGKPEGIALDDAGNLHVCGEPDDFLTFSRQQNR